MFIDTGVYKAFLQLIVHRRLNYIRVHTRLYIPFGIDFSATME